jgi:hypothetical protein
MKSHHFMHLGRVIPVVRKYQTRWEICLDRQIHPYHWLGKTAP